MWRIKVLYSPSKAIPKRTLSLFLRQSLGIVVFHFS
jgi:hypothetical protein